MGSFSTLQAKERSRYAGVVTYKSITSGKQGQTLRMGVTVDLSTLDLHPQQMITITPILKSADGVNQYAFEPVVVIGKRKNRVIKRSVALGNYEFNPTPQANVRFNPKENQTIDLNLATQYRTWMRNAELVFHESVTGCANCDIADGENDRQLISRVLPPVHVPTYTLAYVTPDPEEIKQRSETHTADLNFEVGRAELRPNFMNNAAELASVDKMIKMVQDDPDLTFKNITVVGYASPEGDYDHNMELSEKRAKSFVSYIERQNKFDSSITNVSWKGEDWEGLRKAVAASSIQDRNEVLRIIDNVSDIKERKAQIHALSGGSTYSTLLKEFYPPLRRNDYSIGFIARAFDVNETKQVIETRPQLLSLNEMFLVANTYPAGSEEFKNVFYTAVKVFPADPIANTNAAALDIENGNYDQAIGRLSGITLPEALNNTGVALAKKQQYDRAVEMFRRASQAGNQTATNNLAELEKYLQDPE